ncbi:VpsR-related response regulator [uncultured Oceanisphaera sp.]|uniref:VpsR-related response regulator n=1 Tax=uncultured Oceanisphaera sp. TaxID=353858 RepID=UPI00260403BC|nr:VpsR-related response regulator [uncultured Oceanisphaera sp.]
MTSEREILVLQYSSGLRVLGNQHSDWSLIRYKNLEAAGLYLESSEVPIGIIDCNGAEKPDYKLECWLNSYKGVSWIAVISKKQLFRKEWQLFVAAHCYDYHTTPISEEKLFITIGRAYGMTKLKSNLSLSFQRGEIIGRHDSFQHALQEMHGCASGDITLSGEEGTGKRLIAERWAQLKGLQFVELDKSRTEHNDYMSMFDSLASICELKTVCLYVGHIEELPQHLQLKVCSFLKNEVSSSEIIFGCGLSRDEVVDAELFVSDFSLLLKNKWINVPPLRSRGHDKVLLAKHYLYKFSREQGKRILGFSSDAEMAIFDYDWPGNVTELMEKVAAGVSRCEEGYLNSEMMDLKRDVSLEDHSNFSLKQAREEAESLAIKRVLNLVSGRPGRAAELLCISRASLHRLIARYGIRR